MNLLNELIDQARAAADPTANWMMDGARACPIGWDDCSQPVYHDLGTGTYDHGEPDGPAAKECEENCKHRMQLPEEEEHHEF